MSNSGEKKDAEGRYEPEGPILTGKTPTSVQKVKEFVFAYLGPTSDCLLSHAEVIQLKQISTIQTSRGRGNTVGFI